MANPLQTYVPKISDEVPWHTRLHINLLYQKLNNVAQAVVSQKAGTTTSTTTIEQLGSGGIAGPAGPPGPPGSSLGGINDQTGNAAYTTTTMDNGVLLVVNRAGGTAVTLNSGVSSPFLFFTTNLGTAGVSVLTPSSGTINGGASFALGPLHTALVVFGGTNWVATVLPVVVDFQTNSVDNISQSKLNLIQGANVTITDGGSGNITIAATGTGSGINQLTGDVTAGPGTGSQAATVVATHLTSPLPIAQGGTGTATPALVAGTNVSISGTFPNQTISATTTTVSAYTPRIEITNYTAVANDAVFMDTSGGGHTVTLPAAASNSGVAILVKKISTDSNNLTIVRTGSDLIDGGTSQTTSLPLQSYTFVSDGVSNWWII